MSLRFLNICLYYVGFLFSFIKLFVAVVGLYHCFLFFLRFSLFLLGCLPLDADPLLRVGGLGIASWALMLDGKFFPTRPWSPAVGPTKLVSPFSLPSISSFFSRLLLGMGMFCY